MNQPPVRVFETVSKFVVLQPCFHRTLQEEFFAVAFRKTLYESLDQLQADLDRHLEFCNWERAHQGYRTEG